MKHRIGKLASALLLAAVMAGCAVLTSARSAMISAHLVEPTADPPPTQPPTDRSPTPMRSSSPSSSLASASISDLSRSTKTANAAAAAAATIVEQEEAAAAAAQSQQQINQQHARSHHNHNQHLTAAAAAAAASRLLLQQQQQQQLPTTSQSGNTGIEEEEQQAEAIEQILAAAVDLSERRRWWRKQQQQQHQQQEAAQPATRWRSDSMSQKLEEATTALEPDNSLSLLPPTITGLIASGRDNQRLARRRRLIKRSGISDQKLAEMQMIRALKKQSDRAASNKITLASNLSTTGLELATT